MVFSFQMSFERNECESSARRSRSNFPDSTSLLQRALARNRSGSECQAQACGDEQLGYGRADKEIFPREDRCADAIKKEQSEDWPNQNRIRLDQPRQLPKQN